MLQKYRQGKNAPEKMCVLRVQRCSSCLLYAEAEVEQAVGGVRLSIGSLHLGNETNEAFTQLRRGAPKNVLV